MGGCTCVIKLLERINYRLIENDFGVVRGQKLLAEIVGNILGNIYCIAGTAALDIGDNLIKLEAVRVCDFAGLKAFVKTDAKHLAVYGIFDGGLAAILADID